MNTDTTYRKSALYSAILLAIGINGVALMSSKNAAEAAPSACANSVNSDSGNFTMLNAGGGTVGGTNNVFFTWDGSAFTNSSDYSGPGSASNVAISSTTPFFGYTWTAHDVQLFAPGTYSFDVTSGGGAAETGTMSVTVGPGQLGMHMLFDWHGSNNIDVFVVSNLSSAFGPAIARSTQNVTTPSGNIVNNCDNGTVQNCLYDAPQFGSAGKPAGNKVWMMASTDGNGDGIMGIPMPNGGPFAGFNANFNFSGTFVPTPGGVCSGFVDITPDPYSFTPVTNAALGTVYTSNTITVSGLGGTASVTITGGEYNKNNSGVWTTAAGTATNGDTFQVRGTSPAADGQKTNVILAVGNGSSTFSIATPIIVGAQGSNFTMIGVKGEVTGGTNDVVAQWDGQCDSSASSTNFSHMSLSSVTPFFQYPWTAHHIRVFCPGTYTIDTTCTTAQLEAGTTTCNNPLGPNQTKQFYTFTVGPNQIGAHMLFDWNNTKNIDVVDVWDQNAVFGPSSMYTGPGACNNPLTAWNLMSTDWDHDGKNGGAMVDGPFIGFSANFNIRTSGTPLTCAAYTPTVNIADPSNAPGCSISQTPVSAAKHADWWLVTGFLAWLGGIRLRLGRKKQS